MNFKNNKRTITALVLKEMDTDEADVWKSKPIDDVVFSWWMSGRTGLGLRLTDQGFRAFECAKITKYNFPYTPKPDIYTSNKLMFELNEKILCPYYLGTSRIDNQPLKTYIIIYDRKVMIAMTLYGDIHKYLESIDLKYK